MRKQISFGKRYLIVMAICVVMNQGLYTIAHIFHLPVWFDISGTALAAIMLEPAAGIVVGFINNFYLSLVQQDIGTIIYFAVSAAIAVICGLCMRDKDGKISAKKIVPTLILVCVISTIISSLLTLYKSGGYSNSPWELHFYHVAANAGVPHVLCCFFGTGVVKVLDTVANGAVVAIVYMLLPKNLRNQQLMEK